MTAAYITRPHRACPLCGAPMRVYSLDRTNLDRTIEDRYGGRYYQNCGETVALKWQCAKGHRVEASGNVPHGTIKVEEERLMA